MMDDDPLFGLFLFGVGVLFLAAGLLVLATLYIVVLIIISYIQYQQYLREAEDDFDQIAQELGVDLSTDEILMSMGVEVPRGDEFETVADWMAGTPLGIGEQ